MYVEDGSNSFCLSYTYRNPKLKCQKALWKCLIANAVVGFYQHRPRLIPGDFNDIKDNEKDGGVVKYIGGFYTWI